ncbi:MAG TPA: universal stress protein [Chitinophagaceae bacterium]
MHKLFNNILVPVDNLQYSVKAVEKAVQFSKQFSCDVHLLHAIGDPIWKFSLSRKISEKKFQLHELRDQLASLLPAGCLLHASVANGSPEKSIEEYVAINRIDLVIALKQGGMLGSLNARMNINRLAGRIGCPVLSLQSRPSFEDIRNIVLPVGDNLPLRKMMLAIYLAKQSNAAIHLITLSKNNASSSKSQVYLEKTYQLLRENTGYAIKCSTVVGENIADTTLEYARNVEADLILVNPGSESLLSGPMNRLFSKFLFNSSSIPVLTVA